MSKKSNYLKLLLALLSGWSMNVQAQTSSFNYTGGMQTYTVPAGVTCINVDVRGAGGGMAGPLGGILIGPSTVGKGGRTQATMAVVPGDVLRVYVGGRGVDGDGVTDPAGGYNGGGSAAIWPIVGSPVSGGSGGGASDIQVAPYGIANRAVVGAGGGGGGYNGSCPTGDQPGADGGGTTGLTAVTCTATLLGSGFTTVAPAAGGGPFSGGAGGVLCCGGYADGTAGALGIGGDNVDGGCSGCGGGIGGGGGGGYYGGGGACWTGGGGGSSYANPGITSAVTYTSGYNTGDGLVIISPGGIPSTGTIVGPPTICVGSTGTYTNPTAIPVITWTSSDPLIATVGSTTGVATGVTAGVFNIICTVTTPCGFVSSSMSVTVNPIPAAIAGPGNVCAGDSITLTDPTTGGTWSSVSPLIGTIDAPGNFAGIAGGTSVVSYTVGGCSVSTTETVNTMPAAIAGPTALCISGGTAVYTDATPAGTWSSNVSAVLSISGTGIPATATINNYGTADIYYTVGACFQFVHVIVSDTAFPITGANEVCQGGTIGLVDVTLGGVWASSLPAATVTTSGFYGIVNALGFGIVTISYTTVGCPSKTHIVTIDPLPANITGSTAICTGLGTLLGDTTAGGIWSSSSSLVTVSPSGEVNSSTVGITDTIYYSLLTGCYRMAVVNVSTGPPAIVHGKDSVCQGATITLTDADTTHTGIWSTTSLAIAQVIDSSGMVTGISAGDARISYTWPNGCFAVDTFKVLPLLPGSVSITGPAGPICSGMQDTFIAHATNGGAATYVWKKFSTILFTSTSDTLMYPPIHGDVVMCYVYPHGVCALYDSVIDSFAVNVYPDVESPVVTISTTQSDSITYIGEIITFNALVTWTGSLPTYQWYVNGLAYPGATSESFALAVYQNDTVSCQVSGLPPCPASPLVPGISNSIAIRAGYEGVGTVASTLGTLSLFPNPNSGTFTLTGTATGSKAIVYDVSNVLGQVVYTGSAIPQNGKISEQVKIADLAPGTYLLRAHTETSNETFHFVIGK